MEAKEKQPVLPPSFSKTEVDWSLGLETNIHIFVVQKEYLKSEFVQTHTNLSVQKEINI